MGDERGATEGLLADGSAQTDVARTISFCTPCANRLYQLKQTFAENLKIIIDHPNTEWTIFNLSSKDDLDEFMMKQLPASPPRVIYARALADHPWHMSFAKNAAHRLASGDILVNLDSDNFIGGTCDTIRDYFGRDIRILHLWSGTFRDGTCGRIAIDRVLFHRLGGYDESFHPMGYNDIDLLERARAQGVRVLHIPTPGDVAIKNDKTDSMRFCSGTAEDWDKWNLENKERSQLNIANNRLVANEGKNWGQLELEIFRGKQMR